MRKSLWALSVAACLVMGSTAFASDNCCWDWSNQAGKFDALPGGGGNPGGPPSAQAPNGWAHCSNNTQPACFQRQGRQVRVNPMFGLWTCDIPSDDPDGNAPIATKGFICLQKEGPGSMGVQRNPFKQTSPPGAFALLDVEPGQVVPSMSEWAMGILFALFLLGGVWMLRRQKPLVATS